VAPYNGGSPITRYTVYLRFTEDSIDCDGSDADIMSQKRCEIPFTTFTEAPFNIVWGSSIYAKVKATSIMGDSLSSTAGNGAVITKIPDPPIDLESDHGISNAVVIGLLW
jgi:hypothetical protein